MNHKNLKLIILQGIPGSGKSHWARAFIKNNSKDWVIINRDFIRDMLGNYWVPSREKLVTAIEYSNISLAFGLGYNVIVDATNLNPGTVNKLKDIHLIDQGYNVLGKFMNDSDAEIKKVAPSSAQNIELLKVEVLCTYLKNLFS